MAFRAFRELMDSVLCYRDCVARSSERNTAQMMSHRPHADLAASQSQEKLRIRGRRRGVPACRQISRPEWSWPPRHPPRHPKAEHDPISAAGARPELALIRKRLNVALGGRAAVVISEGRAAPGKARLLAEAAAIAQDLGHKVATVADARGLLTGSQVGSHHRPIRGHIKPAAPFDFSCSSGIQAGSA